MEGRHCFGHLTIEENLLTGAFTRRDGRAAIARDIEKIYGYFPRLKQRRGSLAGYVSGGEQQMCALGRAMMAKPKLILLDEPSMGLAPQVVEEIFEIVRGLNAREKSRSCSPSRTPIWRCATPNSAISWKTAASCSTARRARLRDNEDVREFYLGVAGARPPLVPDVKSYRRRKRWLA